MSLESRIQELATRVAQEFNLVRTGAVTRAELDQLAAEGDLVPGKFYRVTDEDGFAAAITASTYVNLVAEVPLYGPNLLAVWSLYNDFAGGVAVDGADLVFNDVDYYNAGAHQSPTLEAGCKYHFQCVITDLVDAVDGLEITVGGSYVGTFSAAGTIEQDVQVVGNDFVELLAYGFQGRVTGLSLRKVIAFVPALAALTLSASSVSEASPIGTFVGIVQGRTPGAVLTLADDAGGRFVLVSGNILTLAELNYEAASSHGITLRETLGTATNSPRDTVITINVTDQEEVTLNALELSNYDVFESAGINVPVGEITNRTPGSTLTMTNDAGGKFGLLGVEITVKAGLDYETAATHEIEITETVINATNSPRVTPITINVVDQTD